MVIIDASILRREMLYEIDQFVMRGGNLIVMIAPYVRFNRASNAVNPSPSEKTNDITDLLAKWGVRYAHEFVVGDIRDFDSVFSSMKGIQEVYHLAALIGIPYSYFSPLAY